MLQLPYTYTPGLTSPPPAPFVPAVIKHTAVAKSYRVWALLDTGADKCYVPRAVAEDGGWLPVGRVDVVTPVGVSRRPVYYVVINALAVEWRVLAVGCEKDFAILGRDLLNQWVIKLDGPRLKFEITQE
jgi:hypothetical protein